MEDRNAKACRGFVWIKPRSARDGARGCLVFPVGVRKATDRVCDRPGEGTPRWVTPGRDRHRVRELVPLTLLCLKERSLGGPGQMDLEARESPGGCFMIILWCRGKAIGREGSSPREGAKGGSRVRHRAWLKRRRGWTSVRTKFTKIFPNGLLDEWGAGGGVWGERLTWALT